MRHVLLRDREPVLRGRLREPSSHAAVGSAGSGSAAPTGSTSAARPTGSCRRPSGAVRRSRATGIAPGTRATRSSSRSARRTFLSRRFRWRAFYAMLANGGNVVTPHLVSNVEQPGGKGSPRVVLRRFAPRPPQPCRCRPCARWRPFATASILRRTRRPGHPPVSSATTRCRSRARRARQRRSCRFPATRATISKTSRGGVAGGPPTRRELVVCALIENGGHGSSAAAPAALRVFERYFGVKAPPTVVVDTD